MSERYLLRCLDFIFQEMCDISSKTTSHVDEENLRLRKKILYKMDYFINVNKLLLEELNKSKSRIEKQIKDCESILNNTS